MSNIVNGCRNCKWRKSDLYDGKGLYGDITLRCKCQIRHDEVDVKQMSKSCEFYKFSPVKELLTNSGPSEIV